MRRSGIAKCFCNPSGLEAAEWRATFPRVSGLFTQIPIRVRKGAILRLWRLPWPAKARGRVWAFLPLFWVGLALAEAPVLGSWLGPVDPDGNRSTVEIYACEDAFCGRVSAVTVPTSSFLLDQVILVNLRQRTRDRYVGGKIRFDHVPWVFSGSIQMQGSDRLNLRACWAFVICQNLPYERVS